MIRQVLRNGQITLPKEAVQFFHLKEKDLVEVEFDRSGIHLKPIAMTPEEYEKLAQKLDSLKKERGKIYRSSDEVRKHLDDLNRP